LIKGKISSNAKTGYCVANAGISPSHAALLLQEPCKRITAGFLALPASSTNVLPKDVSTYLYLNVKNLHNETLELIVVKAPAPKS